MSQLKYSWSEHSRLYRPSSGLHAPRMASHAPNQAPTYHLPTFQRAPGNSAIVRDDATKKHTDLKRDCVVQPTVVSPRHKGASSRAWTSLKGLLPGSSKRAKKLDTPTFPVIPQDRRKAYGSFSHPVAERVQVRNSTVRTPPSVTAKPDDQRTSRRHADVPQRTANWSDDIEHATLHPRPHVWSWLPPASSQFVRLNPYLQHHCSGPHPIMFDIARGPSRVMHTIQASSIATPLDPTQLSKQPATYPTVTHMHIQTVAEDPLPHFPWPIEVVNPHGITCGDVFDAVAHKFLERVSEKEYNSWTEHRKLMAARTYHQRVRTPVDPANSHEVPDVRDGLRRIDYVGGKVIFHGLEQASTMLEDTWFMYVGDHTRSTV